MRAGRLACSLLLALPSLPAHAGWIYAYRIGNAAGVRCEKRGITTRPVQRRISEEIRALRSTGFAVIPGSIITERRADYREAETAWKRRLGPGSCRLDADGFRSESWRLAR